MEDPNFGVPILPESAQRPIDSSVSKKPATIRAHYKTTWVAVAPSQHCTEQQARRVTEAVAAIGSEAMQKDNLLGIRAEASKVLNSTVQGYDSGCDLSETTLRKAIDYFSDIYGGSGTQYLKGNVDKGPEIQTAGNQMDKHARKHVSLDPPHATTKDFVLRMPGVTVVVCAKEEDFDEFLFNTVVPGQIVGRLVCIDGLHHGIATYEKWVQDNREHGLEPHVVFLPGWMDGPMSPYVIELFKLLSDEDSYFLNKVNYGPQGLGTLDPRHSNTYRPSILRHSSNYRGRSAAISRMRHRAAAYYAQQTAQQAMQQSQQNSFSSGMLNSAPAPRATATEALMQAKDIKDFARKMGISIEEAMNGVGANELYAIAQQAMAAEVTTTPSAAKRGRAWKSLLAKINKLKGES